MPFKTKYGRFDKFVLDVLARDNYVHLWSVHDVPDKHGTFLNCFVEISLKCLSPISTSRDNEILFGAMKMCFFKIHTP